MERENEILIPVVRHGMVLGLLMVGMFMLLAHVQSVERVAQEITAGAIKLVAGTAQILLGKGGELYTLAISQGWRALDGFLGTSVKTTGIVLIACLGLGALSRWGAIVAGLLAGGIGASLPMAFIHYLTKKMGGGWVADGVQVVAVLGCVAFGLLMFGFVHAVAWEYLEEKLPGWLSDWAFWLAIPFILVVERSPSSVPSMIQKTSQEDILGILTVMLWARLFCGFYDRALGREYVGEAVRSALRWMEGAFQVRIGTVQFWLAITLAFLVYGAGKMVFGTGYAVGMVVLFGAAGIVFLKPGLRFMSLLVLVAALCEATHSIFRWVSSFSDRLDGWGLVEVPLWAGALGLVGLLMRDVTYGWHQALLGVEKLNTPWRRGWVRALMLLGLVYGVVKFWPQSGLPVDSRGGDSQAALLAVLSYLVGLFLLKNVTVSTFSSEPALFFSTVSWLLKPLFDGWSRLCEWIRDIQAEQEAARERELMRKREEIQREIEKKKRLQEEISRLRRAQEEREEREREEKRRLEAAARAQREAAERVRREAAERAQREEEERKRAEAYEQGIRDLHAEGRLWKRCQPKLRWNWTCKGCGTVVEAEGLRPTCIVCDQGIPLTEDIQPVCSQCDKRFCLKNGMPEETTELTCGSEDYYRRTGKLPRSASGSEEGDMDSW
jgi:rubrerythrin